MKGLVRIGLVFLVGLGVSANGCALPGVQPEAESRYDYGKATKHWLPPGLVKSQGKVTAINPNSKTVSVKTPQFGVKDFVMVKEGQVTSTGDKKSLTDVKVGDRVYTEHLEEGGKNLLYSLHVFHW